MKHVTSKDGTPPCSVPREIEDIEAVTNAVGGHAYLYGISSGAVLTLEAACALPGKVDKPMLYEASCVVDDARPPVPAEASEQAAGLAASDRCGGGGPALHCRLFPGARRRLYRADPAGPLRV